MRVGIIGCGYVGERIVRTALTSALPGAPAAPPSHANFATPIATTRQFARTPALARLGADARVVDPCDAAELAAHLGGCDVAIHSVPPSPADHSIPDALRAAGVPALVYLGSTAVYPPVVRGTCDEDTPVDHNRFAEPRLAAEAALAASGLRVVILRIAGIYGPGRGLHTRLRAGTHQVPGSGDNFVSRIHVDDLAVIALAAARAIHRAPPATVRIYTIADDRPMTARAAADLVAARIGAARARSVPIGEVHHTLRSDRQVSSARAQRELGVHLRFPSLAEGLEQCLVEEARSPEIKPIS